MLPHKPWLLGGLTDQMDIWILHGFAVNVLRLYCSQGQMTEEQGTCKQPSERNNLTFNKSVRKKVQLFCSAAVRRTVFKNTQSS